jgi:hypothetical protein
VKLEDTLALGPQGQQDDGENDDKGSEDDKGKEPKQPAKKGK